MALAASLLLLPDVVLQNAGRHIQRKHEPGRWFTVAQTTRSLQTSFSLLIRKYIADYPKKYMAHLLASDRRQDVIPQLEKYKEEIAFITTAKSGRCKREVMRKEIILMALNDAEILTWLLREMPTRLFHMCHFVHLFDQGDSEIITPLKNHFWNEPLCSLEPQWSHIEGRPIPSMDPRSKVMDIQRALALNLENECAVALLCDFFALDQKSILSYIRTVPRSPDYSGMCMIFPVLQSDITLVDVVGYNIFILKLEPLGETDEGLETDVLFDTTCLSLIYLATHPRFQPVSDTVAAKLARISKQDCGVYYYTQKLCEYGKVSATMRAQLECMEEPKTTKNFRFSTLHIQPQFLRRRYADFRF